MYIIGGFDGEEIFKSVWRLDMEALTWQEMPPTLKALYFSAACLTEVNKGLDSDWPIY